MPARLQPRPLFQMRGRHPWFHTIEKILEKLNGWVTQCVDQFGDSLWPVVVS